MESPRNRSTPAFGIIGHPIIGTLWKMRILSKVMKTEFDREDRLTCNLWARCVDFFRKIKNFQDFYEKCKNTS